MKFVKIYEDEVKQIDQIYRSVMIDSASSLFFKEGRVLGRRYVVQAEKDWENYFKICQDMIKEDGWVNEITFFQNYAEVTGSLEVHPSVNSTCNRLRGIITIIYEEFYKNLVYCKEKGCQSVGDDKCIFEVEIMEV